MAFAQSIMDSTGSLFEEIIDIEAAGRRRLDDGGAGVAISYTGIARIDGTDNGEQVSADLLEQSMDALTLAIDDGSLTTLQAADSAFAAVTVDETATRRRSKRQPIPSSSRRRDQLHRRLPPPRPRRARGRPKKRTTGAASASP